MLPRYFDSHNHLNDEIFDNKREEIIKKSIDEGIKGMIIVGYDIPSSIIALDLAQKFEGIYASCGIHPHEAKEYTLNVVEELSGLAKESKIVAIGEIGLDYYKWYSPREKQKEMFEVQIELAQKLNLPIILHVRKSFPDVFQILRRFGVRRGVFHCFSGGVEEAKKAVEMGFYISFSGSVTYNSPRLEKALRVVPLDKLLIETDAPYILPKGVEAEFNEPIFIKYIVSRISELLELEEDKVAEITYLNALKFIGEGIE